MDIRKQIKDFDVDISSKCRQYEELRVECNVSDCGVSPLTANISESRDVLKTKRNNNILVLDDKERNMEMVKANLKDDGSNYIVVDFDGEYYRTTASDFEARGYEVKRVNLVNPEDSNGYNPFAFIQDEVDVDIVAQCIVANTSSKYYFATPGKERFYVKGLEMTFLKLLISSYMKYGTVKSLTAAVNLLKSEDREEKLDKLFSGNFAQGPKEMECKRFQIFKQDAGDRYSDILQSCYERIQVFKNNETLVKLTKMESIDIHQLYKGKQVLYIIMPSTLREVELFTSIILSQILYTLCNQGRKHNNDRRVMLYLNYFADAGVIANLDRMMPDMQHYNVGCIFHINNLARITQIYPKWKEWFDYCDTILYLGSNDDTTRSYLYEHADATMIRRVKVLGKEMYKISALKQDEIKDLKDEECICVVKGIGTFLSTRLV